jgi:hypothetical protein
VSNEIASRMAGNFDFPNDLAGIRLTSPSISPIDRPFDTFF